MENIIYKNALRTILYLCICYIIYIYEHIHSLIYLIKEKETLGTFKSFLDFCFPLKHAYFIINNKYYLLSFLKYHVQGLEMTQQLRRSSYLIEDLHSIPYIHMAAHNCL